MDYSKAQNLILEKAENPAASIPDKELLLAICRVLVSNGLLEKKPTEDE